MNEWMAMAMALMAGGAAGGVFFGGLWWTVRRCLTARQPAPWFLASFLVRTLVALAVFWSAAQEDAGRLAACLAGFIGVRFLVVRWKGKAPRCG